MDQQLLEMGHLLDHCQKQAMDLQLELLLQLIRAMVQPLDCCRLQAMDHCLLVVRLGQLGL